MRSLPRRNHVLLSGIRTAAALMTFSVLAACGGGGGGGSSPTPSPTPTPAPTPTPTNQPPTVTLGADTAIELPTNSVALTATATDPENNTLTYAWTAEPATGVTFENGAAKDTKAQFTTAGSYTLKLTANDGTASANDTVVVTVNPAVYPAAAAANDPNYGWTAATPADVGMDESKLIAARDYALAGGGSGLISRHGRLVYQWGDIDARVDLKSTTKSIGSIALGLALDDAKVSLSEKAQTYLPTIGTPPANDPNALAQMTLLQLATHTSGFEKAGGYGNVIYTPGTTWSYSDGALNWLSDLLTNVYNEDMSSLLNRRVWSVLNITTGDLQWRTNVLHSATNSNNVPQRSFSSGIAANPNAMARVGLLFLRKGVWSNDQRVLSESFVQTVQTPRPEVATATIANPTDFPNATTNYGVLWWTNATGQLANVPKDAYWGWGLGDSLIVVIPSLDLVIARVGSEPDSTSPHWRTANDGTASWDGNYTVLDSFLTPISQSVTP